MSHGQTATASEGPQLELTHRLPMPRAMLRLLRPTQWSKNGLLFLPFIFSLNLHWDLDDPTAAGRLLALAALGAVIYCALSGATYVINDIIDADRDRAHPAKRLRPIAAGRVKVGPAMAVAVVLLLVGVGAAFAMSLLMGIVAIAYVTLTVSYSLALKNLMMIDVMAVAAAYLVRVLAGAVAIDVPISPWLYVCTMLGALLISIGKRRSEVELMEDGASNHRNTLDHYTLPLLDRMIAVVTPSALIAYALYTFTAPNLPEQMMLTIPFVIYGVFRYLQLVSLGHMTGEPERVLLEDKPMMLTVALWIVTIAAILLIFPRPS